MSKTILLTGATDGIGLKAAQKLATQPYHLWIHGRNPAKLSKTIDLLQQQSPKATLTAIEADLSDPDQVIDMIQQMHSRIQQLDIVINNAGIFNHPDPILANGMDIRFMVNLLAPYLLTHGLGRLFTDQARVINVASAAQSPVNLAALQDRISLSDNESYAQSKLALIMWGYAQAQTESQAQPHNKPSLISVNPKSLLATKMVQEAFGIRGSDLSVGADILIRAALSGEFNGRDGAYYDNDIGAFANPHPDGHNLAKCKKLSDLLAQIAAPYLAKI